MEGLRPVEWRDERPLYKCAYDDCGYPWFQRGKTVPKRCPKCTRRGWQVGYTSAVDAEAAKTKPVTPGKRTRSIATRTSRRPSAKGKS